MSTTKKKTFHILAIDGGGILGLYSAGILKQIEENFFHGELLSNHFNLIAGTSTGGIIALALAAGHKAEEIEDFYKRYGGKIFSTIGRMKNGFLSHKYSNTQLKNCLNEFFGCQKMKDCKTHVCIPAVNASTCQPLVFKTNNDGNQTRDENCKLVDIALATSAAPIYLPLYSFENYRGLVDGGIWMNNPSLIALIEAISCFVGEDKEYSDITILSIGNPNSSIKESINTNSTKSGLLKWKGNIVTLPMKINSIGTDYMMKILLRSHSSALSKYERIDCGVITNEFTNLKLDSADKCSLLKLSELSYQDFNNKKIELTEFFREEK